MAKKKRYMVVPRDTRTKQNGLMTGKGKLDFKGKSAAWVDDPAIAREIDTQHGLKGSGDVWVAQDENLEWHENHEGKTDGRKLMGIHNYTFAQMGLKLPARDKLIGKKKTIGGVKYTYVLDGGKLRLVPYQKGVKQ